MWTIDKRVRAENLIRLDKYVVARKAILLWPVAGDNLESIIKEMVRFIREKMRVSEQDCPNSSIRMARRMKAVKRSIVSHEVVINFEDVQTRDLVASHSKNLADFKNPDGTPSAGTRIEYPGHLGPHFRNLDWYGRHMRFKHGTGTKRNIIFDDEEETLVIDVCLPGETYWHGVSNDQAKVFKEKVNKSRQDQSRRSLEGLGNTWEMASSSQSTENPNLIPIGKRRSTSGNEESGWGSLPNGREKRPREPDAREYRSPVRRV